MRTARFSLLASAAMALALAVSANSLAQSAPPAEAAATPAPDKAAQAAPQTSSDVTPAAAPATTTAPDAAPAAVAPAPAAEAKPAAAAPTLAAAEASVADKLREMAGGKFDRILGRKERTQIEAFYSGREFAPLFTSSNGFSERGKAAIAYLAKVDADGLEPAEYPVPEIKAGADADAVAEAELKLVQTLLTYARHAQTGRVHFSRIAADIFYELNRPEPVDVLAKIANGSDVVAALDSFEPSHPQYKALKAKLAEVRAGKGDVGAVRIASGAVLKYAKDKKGKETVMEDARVPQLRERLGLTAEDNTNYDKALADAVAKFQKEHALPSNGQLTAATVDAMNGPKRDRDADTIIVNMERWRWLPRDLSKTHVMVNIPDFTLKIVHNDKLYWNTRVVVGKPTQPTPIMSAEMKFITVNPTWNVPPSIIQNEYLPALREDPNAMERIGLKVQQNPDGTVRIWQPPGDRNALGRIRFNFPNKFLVYQHDTPDKHLFAHEKRAYSHGCMRVQDPLMYGEKLLSIMMPQENYTAERLRKMFGGAEVNINFPKFLPVHLTYQTAFVDDAGKLQIREDVYGRDRRMMDLLKGSDRKVADIAMDRPRSTPTAPVRAPKGTFGGGETSSGFSFFDRLFAPAAAAPSEKPSKPRSRAARANAPTDVR